MLFIGLLIALAAAAFAAVVLAENWGGATHTIHGFGATLGSLTPAEIFLAGIILTAIFFVALWLASLSSRMRRRASARRREETRSVREEREGLAAERDRLARELEQERTRGSGYPDSGTAYPREGYARDGVTGDTTRDTAMYRDAAAYPRDTEVYGDRPVEHVEQRDH